ncbi:MAG: hypothetical protein WDA71_00195 [Actinomycetota bacterium]
MRLPRTSYLLLVVAALAASALVGGCGGGGGTRAPLRTLDERVSRVVADQRSADGSLGSVEQAYQALAGTLDAARSAETLPGAKAGWAAVGPAVEEARRVVTGLAARMGRLGASSREALTALESAERGVSSAWEREYLAAERRAVESLAEYAVVSADVAALVEGAFGLYDDVYRRTEDFMRKYATGYFRTDKEAADWFALKMSDLVPGLRDFQAKVREPEEESAGKARAVEARYAEARRAWEQRPGSR